MGWGGYMGPKPAPPPSEDDKPVETIRDHETGARAAILVQAMPRRVRNNLTLLRYIYENHPERVR